jgi:ribosomal protein S27E
VNSPGELENVEWRQLYEVAVLETNPALVRQKVAAAERALAARRRELAFRDERDNRSNLWSKQKFDCELCETPLGFSVIHWAPVPTSPDSLWRLPAATWSMARWIIECRKCGSAIHHSTIPDTLENYYFPSRPASAYQGMSMECPDCGHRTTYGGDDLRFQQ